MPIVSVLVTRSLVLILIAGLVPGLAETTENLWHLATAGHTAHAAEQGPDHAPVGDEHGCSGTFHLCPCHHTVPSDLLAVGAGGPGAEPPARTPRRDVTSPAEPDLPGLDRPPWA